MNFSPSYAEHLPDIISDAGARGNKKKISDQVQAPRALLESQVRGGHIIHIYTFFFVYVKTPVCFPVPRFSFLRTSLTRLKSCT